MTTDPESKIIDPKFQELDERVDKFEEDMPDVAFRWCDYEPFECFFLLTNHITSTRYAKSFIEGHARATDAEEGPFHRDSWEETQLPLPSRLELALNEFAKMKGLEDLSGFKKDKEQLFLIAYHGITYFDDPHQGKVRLYRFYVELVEENGDRLTIPDWVV